jgi:hypothetical protein
MARIRMLHAINAGRRGAACTRDQSRNVEQNAQARAFGFPGMFAAKARRKPD